MLSCARNQIQEGTNMEFQLILAVPGSPNYGTAGNDRIGSESRDGRGVIVWGMDGNNHIVG